MPRDYKSRSRYQPESSGPSKIVWLFVGILIGLIISGVLYLKGNHPTPVTINRHAPIKVEKPKKPKVDQQKNSQTQNPQNNQNLQTQFDFYSVLPKNQNPPPVTQQQNTQPPVESAAPQPLVPTAQAQTLTETTTGRGMASPLQPNNITAPATNTGSGSYAVQIATMAKPADADKLKAQLLLLGFDVNVTPVQKNGQTLQRIWVGPFTTKSDAKATQQQLSQNQISSKVLKSTS